MLVCFISYKPWNVQVLDMGTCLETFKNTSCLPLAMHSDIRKHMSRFLNLIFGGCSDKSSSKELGMTQLHDVGVLPYISIILI